ncbi:MAG TPA: adenylyltransferase/cytidyltransferase family protein [Chlamydiales bacterium]|nr:adenylyltransferase/cytidyltransferase family protein [Chlamydiales bacterium]
MKVYRTLNSIPVIHEPIAIAIGIFDGIHKGHQYLLSILKTKAEKTAIITFHNHLKSSHKNHLPLMKEAEKLLSLEKLGTHYCLDLNFIEEIQNLTYMEFLDLLLQKFPNLQTIVLGENATIGKNQEGSIHNLKKYAEGKSFSIEAIPLYQWKQITVSSTYIRNLIKHDETKLANALLSNKSF